MSRLQELIDELCPDGVEKVPLWCVTIWDKKFNSVDKNKQPQIKKYPYLLASKLFSLEKEDGDVFLLSTGEKTGWTTEEVAGEYLCEGEVVTIPWGKSRPVAEVIKYYNGKFVTADNRIATSSDINVLNNKYLFYWLTSQGEVLDSFYRGSGIKHPSMKDVLDMIIPLPPMEVQREIVRILDNFTALTAELTAELEYRKKQYEFYRDQLLNFDDVRGGRTADLQWKTLDEIADTWIGLATSVSKHKRDKGVILLHNSDIQQNQIVLKSVEFISEEFAEKNRKKLLKKDDIITVHTGDVGTSAVISEKYNGAIGFTTISSRIKDKNQLNPFYLCHYLNSQRCKKDIAAMTISDRSNLNQKSFNKIIVPVPPLAEQERIVAILDRFDALCNDLTTGLPAEIAARQKQYEYYRDKLLSFPQAQ